MQKQGFVRSRYDYYLYVRNQENESVYVIIYVDDLLIAAKSSNVIASVKRMFTEEFETTDMNELYHFLGIKIETRDRYPGASSDKAD